MTTHEEDRKWLADNCFIRWRENKWNEYFTRSIGRTKVSVGVPWSPNWKCFASLSIDTDEYKPIESDERGTAKEVVDNVIGKLKTMMNDIPELRLFIEGEDNEKR